MNKPMIGIRPLTDNRRRGAREAVEPKAMEMALAAKKVIEENLFYPDGTHVECVIADTCIGGAAEAAACAGFPTGTPDQLPSGRRRRAASVWYIRE